MAFSTTDIGISIRADAQHARRAFRRLKATVDQNTKDVGKLTTKFRGLDRFWALMAAGSVIALTAGFGKMAAEMQKVQFQIAAFSDGFEKVPEVMARILTLAKSVPFDIDAITKTFVRLKASGIEPIIDDQGNGPLRNLMDAVAAFGGGPEIFQRAGIAIQQMAGKGVISMEELRQQLGEAIPTAMRVMAEQMKMSVGEMIQVISKGELSFTEGNEALNKGFKETFGGLSQAITEGSFLGQITQIKNRFQELANIFVEGGGLNVFTAALRVLGNEIQKLNDIAKEAGTGIQDGLMKALEDGAPTVDRILDVLGAFLSIIVVIGSQIADLVSGFPVELTTGGIIGFFIAGRFGMNKTYGAIIGATLGMFNGVTGGISGAIKSFLDGIPGEIKSAGFLIWFFFGRLPALALAVGVGIKRLLQQVANSIFAFFKAISDSFLGLFMDIEDSQLNFFEKWGKNFKHFEDNSKTQMENMAQGFRDIFKKMFGSEDVAKVGAEAGKDVALAISGDMFTEAQDKAKKAGLDWSRAFAQGGVEGIQKQLKFVIEAMGRIRLSQPDDFGGLRIPDIALFTKLNTLTERFKTASAGFGGPIAKNTAIMNKELIKFDELLGRINHDMESMKEKGKFTGNIKKGLDEALRDVKKLRGEFVGFVGDLNVKIRDTALKRLNDQLSRTSEAMDTMDNRGTHLDRTIEKVESRFAGLRLRLVQIQTNMEKVNDKSDVAKAALERVKDEIKRLDALKPEVIFKKIGTEVEAMADRIAKSEESLKQFNNQLTALTQKLNGDAVGAAGQAVQNQIDGITKGIDERIRGIRKELDDGLITQAQSDATIKRFADIRDGIEKVGEKLKKQAEDNATSFGQFTQKVGKSVEDALASSFENLVTRSKSAKDIILDLYAAITAAAARYLAQEAMMAMFSGGGSGPGAGSAGFSQALQGFSKLIGFQHGGQFIVGGAGGPDSQVVAFRASPGETITAEPPGASRGGGGDTYNINAIDSRSIQQMLMENGGAISAALSGQRVLNRK